jgi:glutaredoxin 3
LGLDFDGAIIQRFWLRKAKGVKFIMAEKHKIEIFSAGCPLCRDTIQIVNEIAGSPSEVEVLDMHEANVSTKAKEYGIRSVPAVVIDGTLTGGGAGGGVDEEALKAAVSGHR